MTNSQPTIDSQSWKSHSKSQVTTHNTANFGFTPLNSHCSFLQIAIQNNVQHLPFTIHRKSTTNHSLKSLETVFHIHFHNNNKIKNNSIFTRNKKNSPNYIKQKETKNIVKFPSIKDWRTINQSQVANKSQTTFELNPHLNFIWVSFL